MRWSAVTSHNQRFVLRTLPEICFRFKTWGIQFASEMCGRMCELSLRVWSNQNNWNPFFFFIWFFFFQHLLEKLGRQKILSLSWSHSPVSHNATLHVEVNDVQSLYHCRSCNCCIGRVHSLLSCFCGAQCFWLDLILFSFFLCFHSYSLLFLNQLQTVEILPCPGCVQLCLNLNRYRTNKVRWGTFLRIWQIGGGEKCNFPLFVVKLFSGSWKQGALHVSLFFSLSQHRSASPAGLSSLLLITLWLLLWLLLLLLLLYGCCNKKKYKKSSTGKITSMMWQFQSKIKLSVNMFQLWRQCYFFLFNPLPKTFFYFINGFKNTGKVKTD